MKPIIGITASHTREKKNLLNDSYVRAVLHAGGLPVILPAVLPDEDFAELRSRLDGILLSGGADVDPVQFHGLPHPEVSGIDPDRDRIEVGLARLAVDSDWPLLAICRGIQVLNVALGGSLYTHIPDQLPGAIKHNYDSSGQRALKAHTVDVAAGSRLADVLGLTHTGVNSFHHQGICDLASGLAPVAWTPDGLVEAVELPEMNSDHRFGIGVQWHPEDMVDDPAMQRLFAAFVRAAQG
jgi:putative glutamine amidotransferase